LDAESIDDLKRLLSEMGYSPNAISEILKWYEENSSDRRA
jgi:hypothetical protein